MTPVLIDGIDICVRACVRECVCSPASGPVWKQCLVIGFLSVVANGLPDGFMDRFTDPCGNTPPTPAHPKASRNGLGWFWQLSQVLMEGTNLPSAPSAFQIKTWHLSGPVLSPASFRRLNPLTSARPWQQANLVATSAVIVGWQSVLLLCGCFEHRDLNYTVES